MAKNRQRGGAGGDLAKNGGQACVQTAVDWLLAGDVVAIPTETVYGLAADATNDVAIAKIFETKGRPSTNPLITHVPNLDYAKKLIHFSDEALQMAQAFWPGPLTIVGAKKTDAGLADAVSAGLDTLAVRVPAHPIMQAVLDMAELPLAAPSANRSGRPSPTTPQHVRDDFGDAVPVLDGGPCEVGLESTVVYCPMTGGVKILRLGGITADAIGQYVTLVTDDGDGYRSPGRLFRHYAPSVPVMLDVSQPDDNQAYLCFGHDACTEQCFPLSRTGDMAEAAKTLYSQLRAADRSKPTSIAVASIPNIGVGIAINDRLRRAAGQVG